MPPFSVHQGSETQSDLSKITQHIRVRAGAQTWTLELSVQGSIHWTLLPRETPMDGLVIVAQFWELLQCMS